MERILRAMQQAGLIGIDQRALRALAASGPERITGDGACIYRRSIRLQDGIVYFIGTRVGMKNLYLVGERPFSSTFQGETTRAGGVSIQEAGFSPHNADRLHQVFPFTAPVSLRERKTTIGCGDRLGLATPGHIRAVREYDAAPVLAQQSVRELTLTQRTFPGIVADATFLVFQEGYEQGYGADGDHLKTIADIDAALAAGMPMITLDLSDVMAAEPALWSAARVDEEFRKLGADTQNHVRESYADKTFPVGSGQVSFSALEAKRCALMYVRALDFAQEVDSYIRARRGKSYDLEISIDETTAPTLPEHHLFIAAELELRGVMVSSLAPRFVGEFQKGVDYIGDVGEFEKQFAVHCDIARQSGGYKISIHSGSDKFTVYPPIGKHTGMRLHLKTAGTSWLQALLAISRVKPALFRRMVGKAMASFADATKLYYVTTDVTKVPPLSSLKDAELPGLLDARDSRQLLHITYGGLLKDPEIRADIYATLAENEETHYAAVQEHIEKHVRLLGVPRRD